MLRSCLSSVLILLLLQNSKGTDLSDVVSRENIANNSIIAEVPNGEERIFSPFKEESVNYLCGNSVSQSYPDSCAEATALNRKSGIYTIQVNTFSSDPFLVYCNEDEQGGGWTVMQRRVDDSIDFFRDWKSYEIGFGNLVGNFFIGLKKLHRITTERPHELLILMTDFDDVTKFARYDSFAIGDESEMYALKVLGKYSGDAGDSLTYHQGQMWTTKDKDNDNNAGNCAEMFKGAWWYKDCHLSNLNGLYLKGAYDKDRYAQGINWQVWHGHYYSLKTVNMFIRPKRY